MSHALVTIVAPLDPGRLEAAREAIRALGNPARPDIAAKLAELEDDRGIHFASLHALPSFTQGKAHLILEFSADGDDRSAIAWIARAIGGVLEEVFKYSLDWRGQPIEHYLRLHMIRTGYGLGANPGLGHIGSPGMTVGRILREQSLFAAVSAILSQQGGTIRALDRIDEVREKLRTSYADMLTLAEAPTPSSVSGVANAVGALLTGFLQTYLWPLLLLFALFWFAAFAIAWHQSADLEAWAHTFPPGLLPPTGQWWLKPDHAELRQVLYLGLTGLALLLKVIIGFVAFLIATAIVLYIGLRRKESSDWVSDRRPDIADLREIEGLENHPKYAHNHMLSLTERKPGWLRYFTLRLAFFVIAVFGSRVYKPGHLGDIGTIHFARWITVPKTRDLVFFSNYGGSWESYLEDFITLAHNGLTGVWSNTVGFPKSTNLFADGATDGERFKRYARQSMLPSLFWYSAYPELNTDIIRANADIRRGLSGAMTEDSAQRCLSRFGSTLRPDSKLVTSEIQSLVFGGLGFLPFATATFWRLPSQIDDARGWLFDMSAHIAWNDGRRLLESSVDAVVQIGLSSEGLAALGLPEEGRLSFPPAFLAGMEARARILGDTQESSPENWWWRGPADAAVIIYGENEVARNALRKRLDDLASSSGAELIREVPLRDLPRRRPKEVKADAAGSGNAQHNPPRFDSEPFGFADGISQPLIQGTYKAERAEANSLHIVAPGEFVLGYPDNRSNLPPGPTMPAIHDPANLLPISNPTVSEATTDTNLPRDLGRNGTFLVIRELEQDVEAFQDYCQREATRIQAATRLSPPYQVTPEFIGAKMVGRWQNGAPLVRSPYTQSAADAIIEENAFLTGFEDPEGLRCPFGAHIRRANPRDSINPGSTDQVAISNRHRVLRVGRKFAAQDNQNEGILFMCLNGDLERQFEFVQQTWLNGNVISLFCPTNLSGEHDPVLAGGQSNSGFTIPTRDGPVKLAALPRFVTMRGGGYFFMPGKRLVAYLAKARS